MPSNYRRYACARERQIDRVSLPMITVRLHRSASNALSTLRAVDAAAAVAVFAVGIKRNGLLNTACCGAELKLVVVNLIYCRHVACFQRLKPSGIPKLDTKFCWQLCHDV